VEFTVSPIGFVKNSVSEPTDEGWADVVSELRLLEQFAPGLRGIEESSHLLVLFWFHQASFDPAADLVRRPRGREDMPELGLFAQRARHRPNPIGVTAVRLLKKRNDSIVVKGLDAINGTPILDIKPYCPAFDSVEAPVVPKWMAKLFSE